MGVTTFNKAGEDVEMRQDGDLPWKGCEHEEKAKKKMLALSEDEENFLKSPPSEDNFEFDYNKFATCAVSVLAEDPRLEKMRYELVPKKVEEDKFWRNYFYRVELVKQSFLLTETTEEKEKITEETGTDEMDKDDSQWEADLEGELSEFQVVTEDNMEVDHEIQKMLDDQKTK